MTAKKRRAADVRRIGTYDLSADDAERVRSAAERAGRSTSRLVADVLREWLASAPEHPGEVSAEPVR